MREMDGKNVDATQYTRLCPHAAAEYVECEVLHVAHIKIV